MGKVFISYRQLNDTERLRVRTFAERVRASGIEVILDQFYLDQHPGGPPEKWPKWSSDQALQTEFIIVIGTQAWFRCFDGTEQPGVGLGAACEADDLRTRIYGAANINHFIRVVLLDDAESLHISPKLKGYHRFHAEHDFENILKWLKLPHSTPVSTSSHPSSMPAKPQLPSGLVTFMFTDIVGSTEMKPKMPGRTDGERQDAFHKQIKTRHEVIIQEEVDKHGGCIVEGTGDGYFIVFADPQLAVLCGVEIQQRMVAAKIFTPAGILQIRIGLNSGQATPHATGYTSSAADKAARVQSKAAPEQVYLSRETHELIRGKVRGVSTASAGMHDMKGVANEELFVASPEGSTVVILKAEATPAKLSPATTNTNHLPRLPRFYGREKELKTIADAIAPETRTWGALIDGPGGMGKTTLAIRAAELATPGQFKHVIFLSAKEREMTADGKKPLTGFVLPSFPQMLNELAKKLGQSELARLPEEERIAKLHDMLTTETALLLLDNLESLQPEHRDQVFTFLSRLPTGCKAIVTSRRRNDVDARIIRLDRLGKDAALQLLSELATDRPNLARATVAERKTLYEETGGNPLLLRWVAGQLGKGRCRTVAGALELIRHAQEDNDPLEFIFGDLLETFSDSETKILGALTYFTTRVETQVIVELAALSRAATQTALEDLTNRALVVSDDEETQFALVPMVADFLRKKRPEVVKETGDRLEKRAYALIAENGDDKHDRFPVLEAAWPTVSPALPLFLAGANKRLQSVCVALQDFLDFTGRWDEWLSFNLKAEDKAVAAKDFAWAGWRVYWAGGVYYLRGQADEVLACAKRAKAHWAMAKSGARERAFSTRLFGMGYHLKQDYPAALKAYREAVEHWRTLEDESVDVATGLNDLAVVKRLMGDCVAAECDWREASRIARTVGDVEGDAMCRGNLATLALEREDWEEAESLGREALQLSERVGRQELISDGNRCLALAILFQGRRADALPYASRAVELYTDLGSPDLAAAQVILEECQP